jgi:D-alanyl-D-alanine carboxypeptidase (penicillin-binding protein 5/6)
VAALVLVFGSTAIAAVLLWPGPRDGEDDSTGSRGASSATVATESLADEEVPAPEAAEEPGDRAAGPAALDQAAVAAYAVGPAPSPAPVKPRLKQPPAAGILFDVDSGEVLWARNPAVERPIASLTKMMTALLIAELHGPEEMVAISTKAPAVEGSRIGVLRAGRKVPLRGLFLGLLLVSGNDAAVALAEHDAGTVAAFVKGMNRRATELGLGCTHFAGPAGLQDTGNSSCAYDLAALARADLANEWIASVTRRRAASVPFPIKGGTLDVTNNHYFVQRGIAGVPGARVTGVKTGLTNGAGRCYVTTARLGDRHLGVVVLDSPDPLRQVPLLLRAGFRAER